MNNMTPMQGDVVANHASSDPTIEHVVIHVHQNMAWIRSETGEDAIVHLAELAVVRPLHERG